MKDDNIAAFVQTIFIVVLLFILFSIGAWERWFGWKWF